MGVLYFIAGIVLGFIIDVLLKIFNIHGVIVIDDIKETINVRLTSEKILDPKSKTATLKIEHISRH